jgi:hypothetical protein
MDAEIPPEQMQEKESRRMDLLGASISGQGRLPWVRVRLESRAFVVPRELTLTSRAMRGQNTRCQTARRLSTKNQRWEILFQRFFGATRRVFNKYVEKFVEKASRQRVTPRTENT